MKKWIILLAILAMTTGAWGISKPLKKPSDIEGAESLSVTGTGTFTGDSSTLLTVEKSDGTDVFVVDTTLARTTMDGENLIMIGGTQVYGGGAGLTNSNWDDALFCDKSTGFGFNVLDSCASGSTENTGYGYNALTAVTTGDYNVAFGSNALDAVTTADRSTAVGAFALTASTGDNNTAVGAQSLQANTTADNNTAIGAFSLGANTTGDKNMAVGSYALLSNTVADQNTAIGYFALGDNVEGIYNTAIGADALRNNCEAAASCDMGTPNEEEGSYNTAVGRFALNANTTGKKNTALGQNTMPKSTTGDWNTALGEDASFNLTIGDNNTTVGRSAGFAMTTGSTNTIVGSNSFASNTTGGGNVGLGYYAGYYETGSNAFYIDNQDRTNEATGKTNSLIYGVFDASPANQRLKVNAILETSVLAGVTANVGSTQGTGEAITANIFEISVCANAGDSVTLPLAVAGMDILIINHGAQSADVFPNTSDAINEAAADTAKALAADASMRCAAYDATNWECLTMAR